MNKLLIGAAACILLVVPLVSKEIAVKQFAGVKPTTEQILAQPSVRSRLRPGEQILWSSTVDTKRVLDNATPVAYLGVLWTLMSCLLCWQTLRPNKNGKVQPGALLFAVPFVLAGLYMLTTPYWASKSALETVCVLTNKRALRIIGGMTSFNERYRSSRMGPIEVKNQGGGFSDVIFYNKDRSTRTGFEGVSDGETCAKILKDQIEAADLER